MDIKNKIKMILKNKIVAYLMNSSSRDLILIKNEVFLFLQISFYNINIKNPN